MTSPIVSKTSQGDMPRVGHMKFHYVYGVTKGDRGWPDVCTMGLNIY